MLVASVGQKIAQVLKERNIVRDSIAVGKHPIRIVQIEMDQASHVVPAAQVQRQDVLSQVAGKLFHLVCKRVRLNKRHALDVVCGPSFPAGYRLKNTAPPSGLFGGFRFGNVKRKRMLEFGWVDLKRDKRHVEQ